MQSEVIGLVAACVDAPASPDARHLRSKRDAVVPVLVHLLEDEPRASRRRRICEVLADVVEGHPALLAPYVRFDTWHLSRNLAFVLGELRDPAGIFCLADLGRHGEYRVRREVLDALRKIGTDEARAALTAFFSDPDPRIRRHLIGSLDSHDSHASEWLLQIVRSRDFSREGTSVKEAAIAALGRIRAAEALPVLKRVANSRWVLGRRRKILKDAARGALQEAYSSR
ncbi:MAG: HEAT repeat domain-containing protein [bacterium]